MNNRADAANLRRRTFRATVPAARLFTNAHGVTVHSKNDYLPNQVDSIIDIYNPEYYNAHMPRARKRHLQVELEFIRHGGRRAGAGRKRSSSRRRVPHTRRPELNPRHPIHVTLRVLDSVGKLRRRDAFKVVRGVMVDMLGRDDLRIIDLSIQSNHLHLICEAASRHALSAGMKSFKTSVARRFNRILGREGTVFADRYHAEILTCPRQVRAAIAYVLNNWRRHREDRGATRVVDEFSTGMWFTGWKEARIDVPAGLELLPRREPRTWLMAAGWKRASPISLFEVPGPRA